ncbi:MAG: hypothetical protein OEU92_08620 [Alphaproteobacteria bacterium]|nr:hypothetical protein [Alphaproteobacteria bacterium]
MDVEVSLRGGRCYGDGMTASEVDFHARPAGDGQMEKNLICGWLARLEAGYVDRRIGGVSRLDDLDGKPGSIAGLNVVPVGRG